ncbi:hypothetical protein ACSSS7_006965 [Eimeria intestinalis]
MGWRIHPRMGGSSLVVAAAALLLPLLLLRLDAVLLPSKENTSVSSDAPPPPSGPSPLLRSREGTADLSETGGPAPPRVQEGEKEKGGALESPKKKKKTSEEPKPHSSRWIGLVTKVTGPAKRDCLKIKEKGEMPEARLHSPLKHYGYLYFEDEAMAHRLRSGVPLSVVNGFPVPIKIGNRDYTVQGELSSVLLFLRCFSAYEVIGSVLGEDGHWHNRRQEKDPVYVQMENTGPNAFGSARQALLRYSVERLLRSAAPLNSLGNAVGTAVSSTVSLPPQARQALQSLAVNWKAVYQLANILHLEAKQLQEGWKEMSEKKSLKERAKVFVNLLKKAREKETKGRWTGREYVDLQKPVTLTLTMYPKAAHAIRATFKLSSSRILVEEVLRAHKSSVGFALTAPGEKQGIGKRPGALLRPEGRRSGARYPANDKMCNKKRGPRLLRSCGEAKIGSTSSSSSNSSTSSGSTSSSSTSSSSTSSRSSSSRGSGSNTPSAGPPKTLGAAVVAADAPVAAAAAAALAGVAASPPQADCLSAVAAAIHEDPEAATGAPATAATATATGAAVAAGAASAVSATSPAGLGLVLSLCVYEQQQQHQQQQQQQVLRGAPPLSLTPQTAKRLLLQHKEWRLAAIFTGSALSVAATFSEHADFGALVAAFASREAAISSGILFLGHTYAVTRYAPPLIVCRRGSLDSTEGLAILKGSKELRGLSRMGEELLLMAVYRPPAVSAGAWGRYPQPTPPSSSGNCGQSSRTPRLISSSNSSS